MSADLRTGKDLLCRTILALKTGPKTVEDIAVLLESDHTVAGDQLTVLKRHGLVTSRVKVESVRRGLKPAVYSLAL
jgi:predicted transcriptional regulator